MKKENSLRILTEEKKSRTLKELLPKMLIVFITAFGFAQMFFKAFPSVEVETILSIAIAFLTAIPVLIYDKKYGKYIPMGISLLCISAAFAVPTLRNGLLVLCNDICDFLTVLNGKIYLTAEILGSSLENISAILIITAAASLLSTAVCEKNIFPLIPAAALSILGLTTGFLSTDEYFTVFIAGAILLLISVLKPENSGKVSFKVVVPILGCAAGCVLLCAVLMLFFTGVSGENILNTAEKSLHSIIYDSKTNAMPEGDLRNLGKFEKNKTSALEIVMEKPKKLYLKGFVGEIYSGNSWDTIPNETLAKYADDFYTLHKNGFFGQNSISNSLEALNKYSESTMSIKNLSACSKRAYLPYALSTAELSEFSIGDANTAFMGKEYSVGYIPGGLSEWYLTQVELSQNQGKNPDVDEHLANEFVYRKFVKENYLSLSSKTYDLMSKIFEGEDASTITEIISTILIYLDENVTYDEDFSSKSESDFAEYFLEKSTKGYSVHYATVATLMLRYFGIPARYVEGYFLSAEDAAQYNSGEKIVLTEENAHAWTEYYLEGVGWIPFEVTPGYMDDELEKAAFITTGESSKHYEQNKLPETDVEQDRPKNDITEAKKNYAVIIAVFAGSIILLLAALAAYILVMRNRFKKAMLSIENADNKTAAAMRFGYAARLLENSSVAKEELDKIGYKEAFEINREALFSEHEITNEQRKSVDDYAKELLSLCKNNWSFLEKIKNKWIKFLY